MYIYIIKHSIFDGWIKLGKTKNIERRLYQYQTYCPDRSFELVYLLETEYARRIEMYFNKHIFGNGNEWYKCTVESAIGIIKSQLNLIDQNNDYLKSKLQVKSEAKIEKRKQRGNSQNIKYDYLVDGKVFFSLTELFKYIGFSCSNYYKKDYKFDYGISVNINGYEIIRKNHCLK